MKDRTKELSLAVREALDRLVRERVARKPGGHLIEDRLRESELRLPLPTAGSGAADRSFSNRLVESIDDLLDDLVQQAAAFRPGGRRGIQ